MAITSSQQRNAVSEGMALGLLMCNRASLPYDMVAVDLSLEGAWRNWEFKTQFPQVSTDLAQGLDGIWAMTRADDDIDSMEIASSIDGDVPAEGWRKLAQAFLERFTE